MGSTGVAVVMVTVMMIVHADIKPQKDFNLQRFGGRWYRVGLAYDSPSFLPLRPLLTASMGIVTPLPNGSVNLTMWEQTPVGCLTKMYHYEAGSVPGQFSYFSLRHNIVKDITVVDTNYTEYAIVLKNKVFNREYTQVALYARSLKVKNEVYQKYKAFALSRHLPRDSIMTPPPAENCPVNGH
ncbi:prostaglandin D2 synthase a [Boleophthalmus pectinirostris]|uniref:prostaglandin D2 synthase a n=1 Tax=Boleophthalmus pectinirostris TaxID=150288 RepID=UPI000A1C53ED|nr:prostaglandin D2 synthase a [Boleophthalmus pectinirostris]